MTRSALLLLNQKARSGSARNEELRKALIAGGLKLIEPSTDQTRDLSEVIRNHQKEVELVIIGGGDGTLHHAMEGLVETKLPVGILPLGTANDFARTLKLPLDPLAACEVILQGHVGQVDLGQVNGKFFCNVASIGLAVEVTKQLKHESKKRFGVLAYGLAALKSVRDSRPFRVTIEGGERRFSVRTRQVTIGNGRSYGGGFAVDESATAMDGTLHLFSLEIDRWWHLIALIPALWKGRLRSQPKVRTLSGIHFRISTRRLRPLIADGEIVGSTPADFRCCPRALNVFLPSS